MRIFGPIPSRRLGRSLGINHIPPKTCSYSCVYCQVGRTDAMTLARETFFDPEHLVSEVRKKVSQVLQQGEKIDYITFVPDGEPTLDVNLGRMATMLKDLEIPLAVISNGSLMWMEDVREEVMLMDWVSLKADSFVKETWKMVDRPHGQLDLKRIMDGYLEFADSFQGKLNSETMLVKGVNDSEVSLRETAAFLADLSPEIAYISIPTRPPAEKNVEQAEEDAINRAFHIFSEKLDKVELLIGFEGDEFSSTGNIENDLLSITAVHPMRTEQVERVLLECGESWGSVEKLVNEGKLLKLSYRDKTFYLRSLK